MGQKPAAFCGSESSASDTSELGAQFPHFQNGPRISSLCGTGDTVDEVTLASHSAQCPTVSSQGHSFVAFTLNELCERPS